MSVSSPVILSVDGFARKIYLKDGIRQYHPVNDIAAELQHLRSNSEADRAYYPLVIEQGGVFKGGSNYTAKYALFLQGAEVIPADDADHDLNIVGEQIDGLGKVGIELINKTGLVHSVNVNYIPPPTTEIVTIEVSQIAQEMSYNGKVYIDVINGEAGQGDYVGTLAKPSNNQTDAVAIAARYNINTFVLRSNLVLTSDLTNVVINGIGKATVDLNNMNTDDTRFIKCNITGTQSGYTTYEECLIHDLTNFGGTMIGCHFMSETPIVVQSSISTVIADCRSAIAGSGSMVLDFSNGNILMNFRAFSGGIRIIHSAAANNLSTLEFVAGRLNFDNTTNTEGTFHIRGVIDCDGVEQPLSPNIIIINNGALSKVGITDTVWKYNRTL